MERLPSKRWIAIARLIRPQGRRGELLAERFGDVDGLFNPEREVWISVDEQAPPSGGPSAKIQHVWQPTGRNAGRLVIQLDSCDSIAAAAALGGHFLHVPEGTLPRPADGYLVRDLIGCTLIDVLAGDQSVGIVAGVEYPVSADGRIRLQMAPDLLSVQLPDSKSVLIPFVQAWIEDVDVSAGEIKMRLPGGLLEAQRDKDPEGN